MHRRTFYTAGGADMTFTQLEYVIAVQTYGSFRKAAEELFLSPSTISFQIRRLEEELGTEIFVRDGTKTQLTAEGAKLLYLSHSIIHLKNSIRDSCSAKEQNKIRLMIYSQHFPFAARCFSEFITRFSNQKYELGFIETNTRDVITSVITSAADVGLILTNKHNREFLQNIAKNNRLTLKVLYTSKPFVYLSSDHPLASRETIDSVRLLTPYPHLYFDQNAHFLPFALGNIHVAEPEIPQSLFVNDRMSAMMMLRLDQAYYIGIGKLTEFEGIINSANDTIKAIPLKTEANLQICAVYRTALLPEAAKEFLKALHEQLN